MYDLDNLGTSIDRLRADLAVVPQAGLNFALKATRNREILTFLASRGLGVDVASPGEYDLALQSGFTEISATGPSFSDSRILHRLRQSDTVLDVSSLDQLDLVARRLGSGAVGLRVRIPLPDSVSNGNTFGSNSRFGIDISSARLHAIVRDHDLNVTRLHSHTGQMSPSSLLFQLKYLLAVARQFDSVDLIDLGGGFFDLYTHRGAARAAFREAACLLRRWEGETGRQVRIRFEPGAALLGPHGFLVTTVQSIERRHPVFGYDVVQVDSSAWNLAPWHKPAVVHVDESRWESATEQRLIAGNTLYENDFFGTQPPGLPPVLAVPAVAIGDRLVLTNAGAYTVANRRDFNLLGDIHEFVFEADSLRSSTGARLKESLP